MVVLYAAQFVVAKLRQHRRLGGVMDSSPLLLMENGRVLHENLAIAPVTLDDLHSKLREANVLDYAQVRAAVIETTAGISVLRGEGELNPDLLRGVRRR